MKKYTILGKEIELDHNLNVEATLVFTQLNYLNACKPTIDAATYWVELKHFNNNISGPIKKHIEDILAEKLSKDGWSEKIIKNILED